MVFPLAMMGAQTALSPLQGLGFGFGYGYGVRLGYHSFKPSKNQSTTNSRLSLDPLEAGKGMGFASAEEMHENRKQPLGLTAEPTPQADPSTKTVKSKVSSLELPLSRFNSQKEIYDFQKYGKIPRTKRITNSSIY